jgi:hypothetical protein
MSYIKAFFVFPCVCAQTKLVFAVLDLLAVMRSNLKSCVLTSNFEFRFVRLNYFHAYENLTRLVSPHLNNRTARHLPRKFIKNSLELESYDVNYSIGMFDRALYQFNTPPLHILWGVTKLFQLRPLGR